MCERLADEALSIGDYVLTGGELPALVVTDAVVRLLPGVLGAEGAADARVVRRAGSWSRRSTRGRRSSGRAVPAVLLSGDHARIARWRRVQAIWLTWRERPDLLATARLTPEERKLVERFEHGETPDDGPVEPVTRKGPASWTRFDWSRPRSSRRIAAGFGPATPCGCT